MKTPEGMLKDKIKAWLEAHGAFYFMPVQTGYGKQAIDFLCCMPIRDMESRFVGIETKAPGKIPTRRQCACMKEIRAAGGVSFWCDSYESFLRNMVVYGLISATEDATPRTRSATRSR